MRFDNQAHRFYCGVDWHARTMYVCVLDQAGNIVLHQDLTAEPGVFVEVMAPFRDGVLQTIAKCGTSIPRCTRTPPGPDLDRLITRAHGDPAR